MIGTLGLATKMFGAMNDAAVISVAIHDLCQEGLAI